MPYAAGSVSGGRIEIRPPDMDPDPDRFHPEQKRLVLTQCALPAAKTPLICDKHGLPPRLERAIHLFRDVQAYSHVMPRVSRLWGETARSG